MWNGFDNFRDFVKASLEHGLTAQGVEALYIPTTVLREYLEAHVKTILYATDKQPHLQPIDLICEKYLQTLSIIVYISEDHRSYLRYIGSFIQYQKDDASLPLEVKPSFLSDSTEANDFFRAFCEHQWKFCPVSLGPTRVHNRRLDPRLVLPLCRVGDTVSPQKLGRDAEVHCVKADPSGQLPVLESSNGLVILKTFPSNTDVTYHNEIQAYTALNNSASCDNVLRYLGSYHTQSPDGKGRIYTIILENADKGTLLDLYRRNNPPINFDETVSFWKELWSVVYNLEIVHHTRADDATGTSCVHQDLKPSNIFVFTGQAENDGEFNLQLKIGDFGMSYVRRPGFCGPDSRATRTYCPPELHWGDDVVYFVGPKVDVWSIGCVILEAAVWVAFGERGRTEFQKRRRLENEGAYQRQRDFGRGDSFHDGQERLHSVVEVFDLIARHGRRSDHLTLEIVRCILNHALVDTKLRDDAGQLATRLDKLIISPRDTVFSSTKGSGSVASSARHSLASKDTHQSYDHEDFPQTPISPSSGQAWGPNGSSKQISPSAWGQEASTLLTRSISTGSYRNVDHAPEANNNPRKDPRSQNSATRESPPYRQTAAQSVDPGREQPWGSEHLLFGIDHRVGERQLPQRQSKQSLDSASSSIEDHMSWDNASSSRPDIRYQSPPQQLATQQAPQAEPWSTERVQTSNTTSSNSTVTPSRQQGPIQPLDEIRSTFPHVSLGDVKEKRLKEKDAKNRLVLPGEEKAMRLLQKRNHLFLIDNSKSMQPYREEVIDVFTNLAHILEKADDDGLDVIFTSNWEKREHDRRTANLVNLVQNNFHKGAADRCLIEMSLDDLIHKVIDDLPSGEGSKRSMASKAMSRLGKRGKGRPISIYILTNGAWNPNLAAKDRLCGADGPIRRLIKELQKRNLRRIQVAFQFIRFGNDPTGIDRLTFLDNMLGQDYPGYDIVDHKDTTASVWPMLVGSLDEGTDLE